MNSVGQSYGQSLPDQFERIADNFDAYIQLIGDVRELYKERATLEREYATKLQVLTKKASEKKAKMESLFVLGNDPTKAWSESTLKQSTLNAVYDGIINSMVSSAQDHLNIAEVLTTQVVDALKVLEKKNEETQKKEMQFFQKLISDRDRTYGDRLKSKQKYDEECEEVEANRQKQGRVHDDRHADRVARQIEQQRNDMLNSKNVYLISTAIANKAKAKFYDTDLVHLEDQLQSIQAKLVERFAKILLHAQALQMSHLDALKGRLAGVETVLTSVDPSKDQDLFIEYNIRPFTAPGDWKFEPCATFYDTEDMSTEPAPKVFLQNKLRKGRAKLQELVPVIETKQRDHDQLVKLMGAYNEDASLGKVDDVSDNYLEADHQLTYFRTSECILTAEINAIVGAIGEDVGAQQPHSFKSSSFSIPTTCGYCKTSIWGLSKQGKTCKVCNLSVHSKCELKVPADCQGGVRRQTSSTSRLSTSSRLTVPASPQTPNTPTASSFVHSVPEEEVPYPVARVIFDFTSTSEFELSVSEGDSVNVLEPDDGSGWVKVSKSRGASGLVPASYLEFDSAEASTPTTTSSQQGSGQYVRALYHYESRGSDELDLKEGELIELSSGPSGGQNYGEGWWEGYGSKGRKGIFPSNYVELV
ncbi:hypothetical protein K435DRAFT_827005 [Dendrothele bispora CBS 962.96]|uniref:FCH-domain-containing protein n=1 Tax=Dendrothele bispora (strain CBS 962.96) TaxID=1314807 RepID=A0A4S8MM94_DENBC|nr:hypothetical protein K435DRAFT_827005 [Dendrothele bispora CBS 962.96]